MDTDSTRSLTYAEMAAVMGITLASAKNLTRRKRWAPVRVAQGKRQDGRSGVREAAGLDRTDALQAITRRIVMRHQCCRPPRPRQYAIAH